MRRTKIVATLGPSTREPERLRGLIEAGADVLRINFSHGTLEQHAELVARARAAARELDREVAILGDLPGPKLRLGDVAGDVVELEEGSEVALDTDGAPGDGNRLPVTWPDLPAVLAEGDVVYLADGRIRLRVTQAGREAARCRVEVGGPVASHQGINIPSAGAGMLPAAVGEDDLAWADFAIEQEMDLLAVSFVRRASDLAPVLARVRTHGADVPVIAKIEKPEAAENAEEIVREATGGIMVARGDLGIELPIEQVPLTQKRLLASAGRFSKPSITATQMLASMVRSSRPTRAEATDVANAILDGTDAVMLSEETAIGDYPIEAVRMMVEITRATEQELPYGEWLLHRAQRTDNDVADTVSHSAVGAAYRLNLRALVVPTRSGRTARLVSAHRPRIQVLALSPRIETVRRLNLLFGVRCEQVEEWTSLRRLLDDCAALAKHYGVAQPGDLIGITAGLPEQELGTNLFEVHRVP